MEYIFLFFCVVTEKDVFLITICISNPLLLTVKLFLKFEILINTLFICTYGNGYSDILEAPHGAMTLAHR